MTFQEFTKSLQDPRPPEELDSATTALWWAWKGDWQKAHTIAQDITSQSGSWVHAYLHRLEGDYGNAKYWYRRAGRPMPDFSPEQEWKEMVLEIGSFS